MAIKSTKKCTICGKELPRNPEYFRFYKRDNGIYYPSGSCIKCSNEKKRLRYHTDDEYKKKFDERVNRWGKNNVEKKHLYCKISRERLKQDPVRYGKRNEYVKKWKESNSQKIKLQNMNRNRILKLNILRHYSSSEIPSCECCGECRPEFLTVDHINGGGYIHKKSISVAGRTFYQWLVENNYPEGYRILCWNCNCSYGIYGDCPHNENFHSTFPKT